MKIDMVSVDDYFVLIVNGEKVDEGHGLSGVQAFETLAEMSKDRKKYPAGIGEIDFKETYIDNGVGRQDLIDAAVDRIERDWKVMKTLRYFPAEWRVALYNFAHGKDVIHNSYPYGVLEKTGVIASNSGGHDYFYQLTPHGQDVVDYLNSIEIGKVNTHGY